MFITASEARTPKSILKNANEGRRQSERSTPVSASKISGNSFKLYLIWRGLLMAIWTLSKNTTFSVPAYF